MALPAITLTGNLVADPMLRFTAAGTPVVSLRVACSDNKKNPKTGEWEKGDSVFLDVSCWKDAEAITEQLVKGMTITLTGVLKQRSYTAKDGTEKQTIEVAASSIAKVIKAGPVQFATPPTTTVPGTGNPWDDSEAPF